MLGIYSLHCEAHTCYNFRRRPSSEFFWSGIWKALHQSRAKSFQCGKPNFVRSVQKPKNELVVRARRHFCACKNFFAKFAKDILDLQKENLRDVVMSNQAHSHPEWMRARNFFVRQHPLLTVEERDLLDDWELVLCEMSTLETVAFLPRLQRCFQRVESFFTEQGGALQKVGARNLQLALRSPHVLQFPTSTFVRFFLGRYLESFTPEQSEVISVWEAQLCQISAEAQERARRSCAQAFLRLQEFFAKFAKDILGFAERKP